LSGRKVSGPNVLNLHAVAVEDFDELGKIGEGSRQSVDLVHDDHVNLAGFNIADPVIFLATFVSDG
jgi:hypothetical protein